MSGRDVAFFYSPGTPLSFLVVFMGAVLKNLIVWEVAGSREAEELC